MQPHRLFYMPAHIKDDLDLPAVPRRCGRIFHPLLPGRGLFDKNVLGVNYNGSVVENLYHPYGCIFSDDVKRLHLREHADNKYILLFFKTVILQQKVKYTYGYKFNGQRMERQKILLPVNKEGRPDYEFMEQYGKQIMLQKYQQYLNYISART